MPLLLLQAAVAAASERLGAPRIRPRRRSLTQQHAQKHPRHLQEYEKDHPCIAEDGVIHYMDQEFDFGVWDFGRPDNNGGNRWLGGSTYDGMPDDCPTEDGKDNGAADYSNSTEPEVLNLNVTTPYPAPTTTVATPEPTDQLLVPDPSPAPSPNQEEGELMLPQDFYDPAMRKLLVCKISAALPTASRRRLSSGGGGGGGGGSYSSSGDGGGDSSSDDDFMEKQEKVARRFLKQVNDVMRSEIEKFTNKTFMAINGPDSFRQLGSRELRPYRPPPRYDPDYDGILLVGSKIYDNVTYVPVRAPPRSLWWEYSVAFWTVDENITYVETMLRDATKFSVESGQFLRRLRYHFPRLKAVSFPGEEEQHLKVEVDSNNGTLLSPLDVQGWDTRRWVGLGLMITTFFLISALSVAAKHRRKKALEQEIWGVGLSTEQDMNQLLTYGWDYDGQIFQAFDKNKLVYRDDDSMLIGGALLGELGADTEVSRTDGTPSSRSQSSQSRSSQSRSSRGRSTQSGATKSLNGSTSRTGTE